MIVRYVAGTTSRTLYTRRPGRAIGMVIHGSGGTDSLRWLQRREPDPAKKSSADFLIRRDGVILRLSPYGMMTYHSGPANWGKYPQQGTTLNATHWGVELEMPNDGVTPPTDAQYVALAELWCSLYAQKH
ncbi:MAG TPA: N-acetylmuramoyl-L-alanine amidase, partial [Chloroflexia bacterium]|nr:N-acetylmuramoyl-L-alanine amidase [Chloroflexia bacterium]